MKNKVKVKVKEDETKIKWHQTKNKAYKLGISAYEPKRIIEQEDGDLLLYGVNTHKTTDGDIIQVSTFEVVSNPVIIATLKSTYPELVEQNYIRLSNGNVCRIENRCKACEDITNKSVSVSEPEAEPKLIGFHFEPIEEIKKKKKRE